MPNSNYKMVAIVLYSMMKKLLYAIVDNNQLWHTKLCSVHNKAKYVLYFQERVQQLEKQLKEMDKVKERELNALRIEKRELIQTSQKVRGVYYYCCVLLFFFSLLGDPVVVIQAAHAR